MKILDTQCNNMTSLGLTETGRNLRRQDRRQDMIRQESAGQDTEWTLNEMTGQDGQDGKERTGRTKQQRTEEETGEYLKKS
jgi:hypothetical protein